MHVSNGTVFIDVRSTTSITMSEVLRFMAKCGHLNRCVSVFVASYCIFLVR